MMDIRAKRNARLLLWMLSAMAVAGGLGVAHALEAAKQSKETRDGLEVQSARAKVVAEKAKLTHYDKNYFDLSSLPDYRPETTVAGELRLWGNNYLADSPLGKYWEDGFRKHHPQIRFDYSGLKTAHVAIAGLYTGKADLAPSRHITFVEIEAFERMFGYSPTEIVMATGSFNVTGWLPAYSIVVHKDNPLAKISMQQLDGIFGTARDGGWNGTTWELSAARGTDKSIRTWGALGLTGEWRDKPINIYGINLRYNDTREFERKVFNGGDKWNENLREYANYAKADGSIAVSAGELIKDLSRDRYGMAWSGMQHLTSETKALPLAAKEGGPYVELTIDSVRDHEYPLYCEVYIYINRAPGQPVDPKVKEYLRYVLSRQGQEAIARDGKYLPLTAQMIQAELKKLQ
ncbi:PstS family phosphate ABC transporter substrate-binding protein [Steroidobacter sp.]|uniref:PstS family phosphate ABC transporter substrate-binding protein n=1 Tax=Steroidobacter sp. TaxID=1978227 RepID=UPI001A5232A6|nr:substrate-binding domain-containing protein [Steroidobacter sp.]MBL8265799.1 hypothetical protein [Steroidobacter sp.]